ELQLINCLEADLSKTRTRVLRESLAASRQGGFVVLYPIGPLLQILQVEQLIQLATLLVAKQSCTVAMVIDQSSISDSDADLLLSSAATVVHADNSQQLTDKAGCGGFLLEVERRLLSGKMPTERLRLLCNAGRYNLPARLFLRRDEVAETAASATAGEEDKEKSLSTSASGQSGAAAMDSLTSFRLGLTTQEVKERADVVLPHHRPIESSTHATNNRRGGGRIDYCPQPEDDWDDEDPDDDLGI
ncbi:hypothetical protein BOX15_Mlig015035g5, partial [Macrostomum lignano]